MQRRSVVLGLLGFAAATTSGDAHAGTCDGVVVVVDNDDPSSGYAETHPENFQTHDVDACAGTYRYLSKYVGDGSTDGRVTWQPEIAIEGTYRVTTSFRASTNRSDDADYVLFGDDGQQQATSVDQRGDGCTHVEIGELWCTPGGSCRLELDGTDDLQSEAADETTFELVDCDPPVPSACDALIDAGFEVCGEGPGRCEGVFVHGEGCVAYCATVGMTCVARFGGEPGCAKEAGAIPCEVINDHASDYCVCEGDAPVATTGTADGDTAGSSSGPATTSASSSAGAQGTPSSTGDAGTGPGLATTPWPGAGDPGDSSCACTPGEPPRAAIGWCLLALLLRRRRRRWIATLPLVAVACAGSVEEFTAGSSTSTAGNPTSSTASVDASAGPSTSSPDTGSSGGATTTAPGTTDSDTTGGEPSESSGAGADASSTDTGASSSTTASSRGLACMDDGDCDDSAPACVFTVCHDGSVDDPCIDDGDCDDAPACVYNQCSVGLEDDACLDDGDCSDAARFCVYSQCHDGGTDDPCTDDGDCDGAPHCVYNACRAGVEGDPCTDDGDCDGAAPHCAQSLCHDGDAGDPCDDGSDCEDACGANSVCT